MFIQYNRLCLCHGKFANFQRNGGLSSSWLGSLELSSNVANISCKGKVLDKEEGFPPIQTLQRYPTEELFAKVVMVRFDSSILLHQKLDSISITSYAFLTIRYAYEAGAKVILTSSWNVKCNAKILSEEAVAVCCCIKLQ